MENVPDYVERDLYDRALELVQGISSAFEHSQDRSNIIDLMNRFGAMVSSRA